MRWLIIAVVLLTAGCTSTAAVRTTPGATHHTSSAAAASGPRSSALPSGTPPHRLVVTVTDGLLTAAGRTLYTNTIDAPGDVRCTGGCAGQWPPVPADVTAGAGVPASSLGTVRRPDGTLQATFRGQPLYRFSGDTGAGQARGDGASGIWHAVRVR
jgi:predicted lipoprotein with Yx(FWY)xxD motif